jgi:hypothetical protein
MSGELSGFEGLRSLPIVMTQKIKVVGAHPQIFISLGCYVHFDKHNARPWVRANLLSDFRLGERNVGFDLHRVVGRRCRWRDDMVARQQSCWYAGRANDEQPIE